MKITREQVEHVAELAMISLEEQELLGLVEDMAKIIDFADKLADLDASGVIPTTHAMPVANVFREDVEEASAPREELTQNAAEKDEGCFIVPKVVD